MLNDRPENCRALAMRRTTGVRYALRPKIIRRKSARYAPTMPPKFLTCSMLDTEFSAGSVGLYEKRQSAVNIPAARKSIAKISFPKSIRWPFVFGDMFYKP